MFWSIDKCQNSESADHYRLTVSLAQVATHLVWVFFEFIRWQVSTFRMTAGSSSILVKCLWNKSCLWAARLKFCFTADLGRENSTGFYLFLTFLSIVTRRSCSMSNSYGLIGQSLTSEFMWKMYAACGNLFTDSWRRQSFASSCDVFNCLFLLGVQNDIQLLSRVFCISWLEIRVWMESFSKVSLLTCPSSRRKRVESLKRFWPHLMAFRSSISTGKPQLLFSLMCFFSFGFLKSSVV